MTGAARRASSSRTDPPSRPRPASAARRPTRRARRARRPLGAALRRAAGRPAGVPVVHLHGGEVTEGALDERVRHAVTKLADQHCVASEDAAAAAAPARRAGRPGPRHRCARPRPARRPARRPTTPTSPSCSAATVARPAGAVHLPPAHRAGRGADVGPWAGEARRARPWRVCGTVVATHPGMDAGSRRGARGADRGREREPARASSSRPSARDYPACSPRPTSSSATQLSGVIEAATLDVPAVDVGDRQRGRLRGDNVVHAAEGEAAVGEALDARPVPGAPGAVRRGGQPLRRRPRGRAGRRRRAGRSGRTARQALRRRRGGHDDRPRPRAGLRLRRRVAAGGHAGHRPARVLMFCSMPDLQKRKRCCLTLYRRCSRSWGPCSRFRSVLGSKNLPRSMLPIAAGGFIYIAGSDLVPELNKEVRLAKSIVQMIAIGAGIGLMLLITLLG